MLILSPGVQKRTTHNCSFEGWCGISGYCPYHYWTYLDHMYSSWYYNNSITLVSSNLKQHLTLHLITSPIFHALTEHIEWDYYFVDGEVTLRSIFTWFILSPSQASDILTKPLAQNQLAISESNLAFGFIQWPIWERRIYAIRWLYHMTY